MAAETVRSRVVAISGAAPYLGGDTTWTPLRRSLPEVELCVIDALDIVVGTSIEETARALLADRLRDADAIIAHATAARLALDVAGSLDRAPVVILVSPLMPLRTTPPIWIARTLLSIASMRRALNDVARRKLTKLRADRRVVRSQLRYFVSDAGIDERLLDEAVRRCADPRTSGLVERTAESALALFAQPTPAGRACFASAFVVIGTGMTDRRYRRHPRARPIAETRGAAMIEAPDALAAIVREALAGRRRRG